MPVRLHLPTSNGPLPSAPAASPEALLTTDSFPDHPHLGTAVLGPRHRHKTMSPQSPTKQFWQTSPQALVNPPRVGDPGMSGYQKPQPITAPQLVSWFRQN